MGWASWAEVPARTTTPRSSDAVYHRLVAAGFPDGYAADDGAALHFTGSDVLAEVVAAEEGARGYRIERREDGAAVETALPTRYLW